MADGGPPPLEDVDLPPKPAPTLSSAISASVHVTDVSYSRASGASAAVDGDGDVPDLLEQMQSIALSHKSKRAADAAAAEAAEAQTSFSGGGLKKGFLLPATGGAATAAARNATKTSTAAGGGDDVIRPTAAQQSKSERLRLPEVAASSVARAMGDTSAWMTPDLFSRVMSDPALMAGMSNARFMQALDDFQKDAASAMRKYKDAADVQDFIRRFMSVMGDHFATLGSKEQAAAPPAAAAGLTESATRRIAPAATASSSKVATTTAVTKASSGTAAAAAGSIDAAVKAVAEGRVKADADVKRVLSDSQVVQLLQDPQVQRVLAECQRDPSRLRYFMSFPDVRAKLMMMQRAGLIRFE